MSNKRKFTGLLFASFLTAGLTAQLPEVHEPGLKLTMYAGDPSESFPPQYQAWNIYTTDGKVHPGLQMDHQARGSMLLYTLDQVNRRFEADETLNCEASPYSLMPPGLENTMTVSEFNDLVVYLSSLQ